MYIISSSLPRGIAAQISEIEAQERKPQARSEQWLYEMMSSHSELMHVAIKIHGSASLYLSSCKDGSFCTSSPISNANVSGLVLCGHMGLHDTVGEFDKISKLIA